MYTSPLAPPRICRGVTASKADVMGARDGVAFVRTNLRGQAAAERDEEALRARTLRELKTYAERDTLPRPPPAAGAIRRGEWE
jgi:hypothetical protein